MNSRLSPRETIEIAWQVPETGRFPFSAHVEGKRVYQGQCQVSHCQMLELVRMSDPLSIPHDKRAGTGRLSLFDARDRPLSFWIIVSVIIGLNVWFDYYHPLGILFDIIIVIILGFRSYRATS
jgi:hypothetical protein